MVYKTKKKKLTLHKIKKKCKSWCKYLNTERPNI